MNNIKRRRRRRRRRTRQKQQQQEQQQQHSVFCGYSQHITHSMVSHPHQDHDGQQRRSWLAFVITVIIKQQHHQQLYDNHHISIMIMARRTTVFLYSYHRHRHHYQHYQQYHRYRFYHRRFYHHRFYHHRFHHHRFKHHRFHHQCFTHHRRRHHHRHHRRHHHHHCVYHDCFYHVFCNICFAFIFTFVIHHLLFTIISSSSNNIIFIIFHLFVHSFDRSIIPSSIHPFMDWSTYPFSESSSPSSLSYGIIIIIIVVPSWLSLPWFSWSPLYVCHIIIMTNTVFIIYHGSNKRNNKNTKNKLQVQQAQWHLKTRPRVSRRMESWPLTESMRNHQYVGECGAGSQ